MTAATTVTVAAPHRDRGGALAGTWRFLCSDASLVIGIAACIAIGLFSLGGGWLVGLDPQKTGPDVLAAPSAVHLLGTDSVGRDVLARLVLGARSSLFVAVVATIVTMVLGIAVGMAAGFFGRATDWLTMRAVDILLSIPPLLVAITILAAVGPSVLTLIIVLIVTYVPQVVRLVRASTLQATTRPFVDSARISGVNRLRIMWRHVLPNMRGVLIVQATITVAHMLLVETVLSFLGLGVPPPAPSLGFMVSEGRQWMEIAPWTVLAPGGTIVLIVAAFTFLGHGLDSALAKRT
ncbi:MAG: ABC transporter permease [Alphaproteobacteria bacterium]|nr:ABC transporter permease [Alphaproteobacteria bacterium]